MNKLKVLGLALGLAAGAATAVYWRVVLTPLPQRTGRRFLRGLDGPAEVLWDRWGVPHVYAVSRDDAIYLQGYLHAQDRLWQMELNRRAAAGRLSELFGARTLERDRMLRRIGFYRVAGQELTALEPEAAGMLTAYCAGVNAFIDSHLQRLPVEFSILRYQPEPWSPLDSLAWAKLMGWGFIMNWDQELYRAHMAEKLGPEAVAALEQAYPAGHPFITSTHTGQQPPEVAPPEMAGLDPLFAGRGSNGWAVSGTRTASGKPLLANDPHLSPQIPSPWYEVHLEAPDFRVAGASLPGSPGVVIGHNQHIAWGATASMVDTQDLYIEEFAADKPDQYRSGDGWRPAELIHERVDVRGNPSVDETVAVTHHGPVVLWTDTGRTRGLALCTPLLEPGDLTPAGIGLMQAKNQQDFRTAMRRWTSPSLCFVYADLEGNIGVQFVGNTPRRPAGVGPAPVPGWSGQHEWQGYLDFEGLPSDFNPSAGYVVTANNKPSADESATAVQGEWGDGFRARRIAQLLEGEKQITVEHMRALQQDVFSLAAQEFQAELAHAAPSTRTARQAQALLLGWDCRVTLESAVPVLYARFRYYLLRRLITPVAGPHLQDYFGVQLHPLSTSSLFQFKGTSFLLGKLRALRETGSPEFHQAVTAALDAAWLDVQQRQGRDASAWRWGRVHHLTLRHPLAQIAPLRKLFNLGPYPLPGDADTVHQASFALGGQPDAIRWAPSYRFVADLADWDQSRSAHMPGQSGQPGSPHYQDQMPLWLRGELHPMPFSRPAVEAVTQSRQEFCQSKAVDREGRAVN